MGMDIYASSGVLLTWDSIMEFVEAGDEQEQIMRRILNDLLAEKEAAAEKEIAENIPKLEKYNEAMKTWPAIEEKQNKIWNDYQAARKKAEEDGDEAEQQRLYQEFDKVRFSDEWVNPPQSNQYTWAQEERDQLKTIMQPMLKDEDRGLRETLAFFDEPSGEIENRYDECEAKYYELANEVWPAFFREAYPELPNFSEVTAFGSSRISGGDVPTGEVLCIFNDEDCYERVPTEAGKKLFEMVGGEIIPSTWTIYSI